MSIIHRYTQARPEVPSNIFHEQRGSLHLLLHPDKPCWLVVNDLGWEIVKLCDGKHDVKEIASSIAARYDREPALVYKDIEAYLSNLSRAHFLLNEPSCPVAPRRMKIHPLPHPPPQGGGKGGGDLRGSLKRLHLDITEGCNLSCIHCGVVDGAPKNESLKKDRVFEIIDELSENDGAALAISGGEPLLHEDCLAILRYSSKRVKTSLSTNATLIDEKTAQSLSSLDIELQISLDGPDATLHDRVRGDGTFDKTLKGIRLLQNHGAGDRIALFTTVMKQNIDFIPGVIKLAEEMGISSIRFLPIQRLGTARSSWDEICPTPEEYSRLYTYLYRQLPPNSINISGGFQGFLLEIPDGDRWCHLGETLAIDSEGDIYPCSLMVHPDFLIGNIYEMSLKEALESERLRKIIKTCRSREENIKRCKDCPYKHFCQACCLGSVFFQKGSLWDTDDLCDLRQRLYPEVIFDIAEKRVDASVLRQSMECEI